MSVHRNYCVDIKEVERVNQFFQGVNCYLGIAQVAEIWGDESDHFVEKWLEYRNKVKFDAQGFYESLDSFNQRKLINWYNDLMIRQSKK